MPLARVYRGPGDALDGDADETLLLVRVANVRSVQNCSAHLLKTTTALRVALIHRHDEMRLHPPKAS